MNQSITFFSFTRLPMAVQLKQDNNVGILTLNLHTGEYRYSGLTLKAKLLKALNVVLTAQLNG